MYQPLNKDKLTLIFSTLFLESTIVQFGKTYPPSLISARCCVIKDSLIFNTQPPRHSISSNIGFVLIQGLTPSFHEYLSTLYPPDHDVMKPTRCLGLILA